MLLPFVDQKVSRKARLHLKWNSETCVCEVCQCTSMFFRDLMGKIAGAILRNTRSCCISEQKVLRFDRRVKPMTTTYVFIDCSQDLKRRDNLLLWQPNLLQIKTLYLLKMHHLQQRNSTTNVQLPYTTYISKPSLHSHVCERNVSKI